MLDHHDYEYFTTLLLSWITKNPAKYRDVPASLVIEAKFYNEESIEKWKCMKCKPMNRNHCIYGRENKRPNYVALERDCKLDRSELFPSEGITELKHPMYEKPFLGCRPRENNY